MTTDLFPETLLSNAAEEPATVAIKATVPTTTVHRAAFRDTTLICIEAGEDVLVAMRPVVEGMGLNWKSQHRKLTADDARFCIHRLTMQMPGDDQRREHVFIPLLSLNGWLMSVSSSKVRPEIRATVIAYQKECDKVLFHHFLHDLHIESNALHLLRPTTVAVARLTLEGKSRGAIAEALGKSLNSVTYHRRAARRLGLLAA